MGMSTNIHNVVNIRLGATDTILNGTVPVRDVIFTMEDGSEYMVTVFAPVGADATQLEVIGDIL